MRQVFTGFVTVVILVAAVACSGNGVSKSVKVNEAYDNIMTRTSIRSYTSQTISKDTITLLLKAGMASPTAVNKQPWKFVAITDRVMLDSIAKAFPYARFAKQAPLIIVPCGDNMNMLPGDMAQLWIQDLSAATENILLAANSLGLGAVWCMCYPNYQLINSLRDIAQLPSSLTPLCLVVIGHPAQNPDPKNKWKEENVLWRE
ncbi:MAG: nitroreductase family protein [Marinifilaceae bacterium]|nr:nitroreductase family protein [Marinifilaceae bacterium]